MILLVGRLRRKPDSPGRRRCKLDSLHYRGYTPNKMDDSTRDETQTAAEQQERLRAALQAYEDARTDGLCEDGAWERAAGVLRALGGGESLEEIITWTPQSATASTTTS